MSLLTKIYSNSKSYPNRIALKDECYEVTYKELFKDPFEYYYPAQYQSALVSQNTPVFLALPKTCKLVRLLINCLHRNIPVSMIEPSSIPRFQPIFNKLPSYTLITDETITTFFNFNKSKDCITELTNTKYLVFSSGSTGAPKLIYMPSTQLENVIQHQSIQLNIEPTSHFLWLLNQEFDASYSDIFNALYSGACLHILNKRILTTPKKLVEYIRFNNISHTDIPPRVLKILTPFNKDLTNLKGVIVGGENACTETLLFWCSKLKLLHSYGPAETTISSITTLLDPSLFTNLETLRVPLGNPIPGNKIFLQSISTGIIYTLKDAPSSKTYFYNVLISGQSLLNHYLSLPQTQDKIKVFKVNSTSYKCFITNDKVRYFENKLFFEGRLDNQIKVNGVLVCLEEIDSFLENIYPSSEFMSYIKDNNIHLLKTSDIPNSEINSKIRTKINSSFVPKSISKVNIIPTNCNGKKNRKFQLTN